MIKKPLQNILSELLTLKPSLWAQVFGMSSAICFGVILFSLHQTINSNVGIGLVLGLELLIILFSVSTFSIYLTKRGFGNAQKLGMRKLLGASGFTLFIEVSVRTTLLIMLSIIISIGIMDISTRLVGLSFENMLKSIGVIHFGILLLLVFIVSEGVMFIVIGVALAPNLKTSISETTNFEKYWFGKLGKLLSSISLFLIIMILGLLIVLVSVVCLAKAIIILGVVFLSLLIAWCLYNKYHKSIFLGNF